MMSLISGILERTRKAPKVSELDLGRAAIYTLPTSEGLRITSNRLKVYRTQYSFSDVAAAYQAQVPGYMESLSKAEKEREIIFAIELESARIDSQLQNKRNYLHKISARQLNGCPGVLCVNDKLWRIGKQIPFEPALYAIMV